MKHLWFILFLFIPVVYADLTCTWNDNTCLVGTPILYMVNYSANYTNAHTQLSNYTPHYVSVLCCNSSLAINTSSLGEGFIKLSSPTNAHSQLFNNTAYTVKYNFSAYISTNESRPLCRNYSTCPSLYTCLCSLSGSGTNAHIAGCSQSYSNQICCKTRQIANISLTGTSGTYPYSPNVTATKGATGDSDIIYSFTRNGTTVTSPDNPPAGNYRYAYSATDGENYTASSVVLNISISKLNTTTTLYLENTINFSGTYPANSSTTGYGCPTQIVCTLDYDGTPVSNPYYNLIAAGNHTFTYSTPGNENHTSATLVWYVGPINGSTTTLVNTTSVISTGGGGSIYPIAQDCTYYFSQPRYYAGDEVSLILACPSAYNTMFNYEWRQGSITSIQPIILFYNTTRLQGMKANLTYRPSNSGYIHININAQVINAQFTILPAISREIEFWYVGLLFAGLLTILYLLDKYLKFEASRDGSFALNTTERFTLIAESILFAFTSYLYLQKTDQLGYLYIAGIGLVLLSVIYLFNRAVTSPKTRLNATERIAAAVVIATIGIVTFMYLQKTNKQGYIYMIILGGIMLVLMFLLNKLLTRKGEGYGIR
jgi:hypothetical protein